MEISETLPPYLYLYAFSFSVSECSPVRQTLRLAFFLFVVCTLVRYESLLLLESTDFCKRMRRLAIAFLSTRD